MSGKVEDGQLVTVEPLKSDPQVDDVVLCRVKGAEFLHMVKAIDRGRFQIGSYRGTINGWISKSSIFGKCVRIEP